MARKRCTGAPTVSGGCTILPPARRKNITKGVTQTSFVDVEDDHNNIQPPSYAALGWAKDNSAVLLSDGWDIYRVPVDGGAAVNLTGKRKKDQIRYRAINTTWTLPAGRRQGGLAQQGIDLAKPLFISTYGEWDEEGGRVEGSTR